MGVVGVVIAWWYGMYGNHGMGKENEPLYVMYGTLTVHIIIIIMFITHIHTHNGLSVEHPRRALWYGGMVWYIPYCSVKNVFRSDPDLNAQNRI